MPKPKGDLGAFVIPKAAAAAARPFQAVTPVQAPPPLPAAAEQPATVHAPERQGAGQAPSSLSPLVQAPGAGATRAMTLKIHPFQGLAGPGRGKLIHTNRTDFCHSLRV